MRIMKIKYPHTEELKNRLHSCLDMCYIPHVIFDDGNHYTIFIDKNKCTWKQVMKEVNRVHPVKFDYVKNHYIKDGKLHEDCGIIRV